MTSEKAQDLINRDKTKKEKAVEAQRRYRQSLKTGSNKTSSVSYDDYKKSQTEYMRTYRQAKKIQLIEAYAKANPETETPAKVEIKKQQVKKKATLAEMRRSDRETKQVDLSIQSAPPISKPEIKKRVTPLWMKNLPPGATEAEKVKARGYSVKDRDMNLKKIYVVFDKVLKKEPTKDVKRVLKNILTGYDIKTDIKVIKRDMPFLSDNNLIAFVNKVQDYYPKATSFKAMITPFVNVLSRLPSYDKEYQQLTVIAIQASKDYADERDENMVKEEDNGKIFSFKPEDVKYHIDNFLTSKRDKAMAACHGLQPPRRLDFRFMKVTENDPSMLNNINYNYLVIKNGEPTKFVYNNYKTYKTYGKQVIDVDEDIVPYLTDYLKAEKLTPVVNDKKYLFGSNNNTQENSNFGTKLRDVFYMMYGDDISSRWIRASAATYINNLKPKPSLAVRKEFANKMAHSRALNEQYEKIIIGDDDGDGVKPRRVKEEITPKDFKVSDEEVDKMTENIEIQKPVRRSKRNK